jgi:hypothetical protein
VSGYAFALALCAVVVGLLLFLLRTRRIQEKYAGIWILVAMAVVVLGAFPKLVFWITELVGVGLPANLLFALAIVTLLAVSIQLSSELSSLEEESRTLAEEIALLRLEMRTPPPPSPKDEDSNDSKATDLRMPPRTAQRDDQM